MSAIFAFIGILAIIAVYIYIYYDRTRRILVDGKNRDQNLKLFADHVEGAGLLIQKNDKMKLKAFSLTYAQILNVDILIGVNALVIQTADETYRCYLNDCEGYRDAILSNKQTLH